MDISWLLIVSLLCAVEGIERLQNDDVVLHRTLLGPWKKASAVRIAGSSWHLIVSLPVVSDWVVLRSAQADGHFDAEAICTHVASRWCEALSLSMKALGLVTIGILGFIIPVAAESSGVLGLIFAFCVLICWTVGVGALLSVSTWVIADEFAATHVSRRIQLASPFAIPSRSQKLFYIAFDRLHPIGIARRLLRRQDLVSLVRQTEWDRLAGVASGGVLARLGESLTDDERRALSTVPPNVLAGEKYCPRCAATFIISAVACSSCELELFQAASNTVTESPAPAS